MAVDTSEASELIFGNAEDALRAILYSLYILHRGSDDELWREELSLGSYPRGLLRARYMFNRFIEVTGWYGFGVDDKDEYIAYCISVIFTAEQDIARMEDRDVDKKTFFDVIRSKSASLHILEISKVQ